MIITDFINNIATNIDGFTDAGTALSTAIIGWVLFWTRLAKMIPTEWRNPYVKKFFECLNAACRIMGLDIPDIAKVDWRRMRIVTKSELIATQIVQAAVIPEAVVENPPPPAAPTPNEPPVTVSAPIGTGVQAATSVPILTAEAVATGTLAEKSNASS